MSRRPSSSVSCTPSSTGAPYPRRKPGQPKSTRQQFSACGACRMRRVRCDLKDFYSAVETSSSQQPSCSNCRERGIRCVDEFVEFKAVKLLRRGRRLQQVEARYGKVIDDAPSDSQASTFPTSTTTPGHSCIPQMQLPFLSSSFFRRFCIQRPVIEPGEFTSRYIAHLEGTASLNTEGKMLAMLLVTWAASFGIDEFGRENTQGEASQYLLRTEAMTREILALVDLHGLLRRPSWDGVRVLLLLLPLTHGIQSPIEHQTTYKATLTQVCSLCNDFDPPSVNSGLGQYCDELVRARVFWYAHVHEGITTGLSGGRLVLDDNDLDSFQSTLPPRYCALASHSIISSPDSSRSSSIASSPVTPTFPFITPLEPSHPRAALAYLVTTQYFSFALDVSRACRSINSTLTGPHARRRIESGVAIRKETVIGIWDELERCWDNFETLRRNPSGVGSAGGDLIRGEDVERFVSGWQIYIFKCLNVIREALGLAKNDHATPSRVAMSALYLSAIQQCQKFLPRVIDMLQRHLKVPSNFFAYDTGLIHDGCFFAGLFLAQSDKLDAGSDEVGQDVDWEEGMAACLQALGEIRWVYSRSEEQEKTLKAEWEARTERGTSRRQVQRSPSFPIKQSPNHSPCLNDDASLSRSTSPTSKPRVLSLVAAGGQVRPPLPPLLISLPHDDSGPDTALTDGSGNWEPYTPPSTSGSVTATVATRHSSLSPIPSPRHSTTPCAMKIEGSISGDDSDTNQFSFSVKRMANSRGFMGSGVSASWASPFTSEFLDPRVILTTSDPVLRCDDAFSSPGRSYLS